MGEGAGIGAQKCILDWDHTPFNYRGRGRSLSTLENPISHSEKIRFFGGKSNFGPLVFFAHKDQDHEKSSQSPPGGCRTRAKNRHGSDFTCVSTEWVGGSGRAHPAFEKNTEMAEISCWDWS